MAVASGELIHGTQLQVALVDVIVHHRGRHVQETVAAAAVAVHKVVACSHLNAWRAEISHLAVCSPVVEGAVYLLSVGEAHMHPVSLGSYVPAVQQHRPFDTHAPVVGAFALALHVQASAQPEEHVPSGEHVAVALRGRHLAPGHEGEASGVEQAGDVPVVGQSLRGCVHCAARPVPEPHFVAHHPAVLSPLTAQGSHTVKLHAEVESCADTWGDGIQAVGHDARGGE